MRNAEKLIGLVLIGLVAYGFFNGTNYYKVLKGFVDDNLSADLTQGVYKVKYDKDAFLLEKVKGKEVAGTVGYGGDVAGVFGWHLPGNTHFQVIELSENSTGVMQFENVTEALKYFQEIQGQWHSNRVGQMNLFFYAPLVQTDLGNYTNVLVKYNWGNFGLDNLTSSEDVYCYVERGGVDCFFNSSVNITSDWSLDTGLEIVEYSGYHGNLIQMFVKNILSLIAQSEVTAVTHVKVVGAREMLWNVRDGIVNLYIGNPRVKFVYVVDAKGLKEMWNTWVKEYWLPEVVAGTWAHDGEMKWDAWGVRCMSSSGKCELIRDA
jgi:hypothetical protein